MKKYFRLSFLLVFALTSCAIDADESPYEEKEYKSKLPYIHILGTIQDAGSPQIACIKSCCNALTLEDKSKRMVSCIAISDPVSSKYWMVDATPDITSQTELASLALQDSFTMPSGIFLTHAHVGHYTGLIWLGKEAMNAQKAAVYTMPKMMDFLADNEPWKSLIQNKNIQLNTILNGKAQLLGNKLSITPILVPHRDELSETVGYIIQGPKKSAVYIPDIDKWSKWEKDITQLIMDHDYLLIDGTFFDGNELPGRKMEEIPHPFVAESIELFKVLAKEERKKVYFIHLNHSNPLLNSNSQQFKHLKSLGFNVAKTDQKLSL